MNEHDDGEFSHQLKGTLRPGTQGHRIPPSGDLREKYLQQIAEAIHKETNGIYGIAPGKPLPSYDDMCKSKGLNDRSHATQNRILRANGKV